MGTKKGFFLSAIAALVALVVGFAVVISLPLPEERTMWAWLELSRTTIKSVRWGNVPLKKAIEECNREIQKVSNTRYRLSLAEGANGDVTLPHGLNLDEMTVIELARYLTELTDNAMYRTPQGIVIDRRDRAGAYPYDFAYHYGHEKTSWRKEVREWVQHRLPWRLPRLFEPPSSLWTDPFPVHPQAVDRFGPSSPNDPFAPEPGK